MGGMAAQIPIKDDAAANTAALTKVRGGPWRAGPWRARRAVCGQRLQPRC
jgi:hypothetical protein